MGFYDFTMKDITGKEVDFSTFKDKVVIVVNTASKCGFTPQFAGLEELYQQYKDQGLVILGFPCNQFAHQDPGTNQEISEFCQLNYGVTFPMFEKIDVNGEHEAPLYTWLKEQKSGLGKDIKWNFTKFVIDKTGTVVARYGSPKKPENMAKDVEKCLKAGA